MKNFLLILSLLSGLFANAQTWDNLTYNENQSGLELNPLKGFATMWQPSNNFPHSIQGELFGLDDVMLGIDSFDWTVIDNFLAQEASEGNHCYIQVNIDPAFGGSDMPAFLVDQVDWQFYDDGNVPDLCPDWNDPDLMEAMLNFIDAFGTKYNNDSIVFLVHLGLYGMWGEWHIGSVADIRPEFEMTEENKLLIANTYINSFPDTYLLARYPENMPDAQSFGYSDGLFFSQSISSSSNPYYFHNTLKTNRADLNWKLHPVGGEIDPDIQPILWDSWPNVVGQDVVACFDSIHPTWLFSHHVLTQVQEGTAEWDNAIQAQKLMGYTFYIDKYRLSSSNGNPAIEVNIQNKGLTPMYANWEVEFGVLNSSNQFQSLGFTKWNLDLIQPGVVDNYRSFISDSSLTDGTYTFLLRVVNPLEAFSADAKPVRFANTSQDEDIEAWISLGETSISSGNAGLTPTQVSGISLSPSSAILQVGDNLQLSANVTPANATNPAITWVSDHPATASVSASGLVSTGPVSGTVIISAYTQDGGFVGECAITVEPFRVNIPALIEAEAYVDMSGVETEPSGEGGSNLGYIDAGDWMEYGVIVDSPADFLVDYRVASPSWGGEISLLNESGDVLDIIQVDSTGGWQAYTTMTSNPISLPAGAYNLRVLASGGGFNLNWIEFRYDPIWAYEADLEVRADVMTLYPKPTADFFKIKGDFSDYTIQILDMNGAVYQDLSDQSSPIEIDISGLPQGLYSISIVNGNNGNLRFEHIIKM